MILMLKKEEDEEEEERVEGIREGIKEQKKSESDRQLR